MSKSDVKSTKAAGNDAGTDMEQSGSSAVVILFFIIGFAGFLFIGWALFPGMLYSKKSQPFDFNHMVHNELVDDGCESCHFFREDGSFAGVPTLAQCTDCHEEVQGEDPNEEIFVNEYVANEKEVPWHVYSRQSDCVFFSHAAHVKKAGMECAECHGDIGESESLKVYEENRITGLSRDIWGKSIGGFRSKTSDSMKMDVCANCHQEETGSKGACFQCHK